MPTTISIAPSSPITVSVGSAPVVSQSVSSSGSTQVTAGVVPATQSPPEPPPKPRGMAWLMTTKSSGTVAVSARSSTGYFTVRWWDGQVQIVGPASAAAPLTATRAVPSVGDWSGSSPKEVYVWPGNRTQSGDLTFLSVASTGAAFVDVGNCDLLETFDCSSNAISSLDLSRSPALRSLACGNNVIKTLDTSSLPLLRELYCQANLLTSLSLSANRSLDVLQCNNNQISSLPLDRLSSLSRLYCHYNKLTLIDLRPAASLREVNCTGNILTSVQAAGIRLVGALAGVFSQNQLSSQALNILYADLAATSGGSLYVSSNPGTSGDTPVIATSKGYVVYGS